ncbi:MAG TPA: DUF3750 domain-containing protein [Alphaproteobacteria bacterium]|nr:DUF3750 domain-containing protein [Alphaproteobacteria bacterium]
MIVLLVLGAWVALPLAISYARYSPPPWSWSQAPRHSSGLAPDPAETPEAVVQVYTARAFSWRGVFATHPWIAVKRSGELRFTRHEVVGWGDGPKLRANYGVTDGLWYGAEPALLADIRGERAAAMIDRIEAAIASYPFKDQYRTWPGPNSNTFLAHIARNVPELRLDIPPTAIGKDYRRWYEPIARSPSGTGVQVSLLGLAGLMVGLQDGVEANLLGLSFGIDFLPPALRLPGLGRTELPGASALPGRGPGDA